MPRPEPDSARGSSDRFGHAWHLYSELRPEHEEQFRRWTCHLQPADWRGVTFLDVGCGMGRNSVWPMRYGAAGGVAVDLDERSLAAARRNLAEVPQVEVRRLDAHELDYDSRFDVAFSIGVVHHVEDPAKVLAGMVRAVKPGGRVMAWVYGLENNGWIVRWADPLRRALFSRLPIGVTHALSLVPTAILWTALRLGIGRRIEYYRLLRTFGFRHLRSIVFDQMLPSIAEYWPPETVEELFRDAGLEDVRIASVNGISWSAIGTRPS